MPTSLWLTITCFLSSSSFNSIYRFSRWTNSPSQNSPLRKENSHFFLKKKFSAAFIFFLLTRKTNTIFFLYQKKITRKYKNNTNTIFFSLPSLQYGISRFPRPWDWNQHHRGRLFPGQPPHGPYTTHTHTRHTNPPSTYSNPGPTTTTVPQPSSRTTILPRHSSTISYPIPLRWILCQSPKTSRTLPVHNIQNYEHQPWYLPNWPSLSRPSDQNRDQKHHTDLPILPIRERGYWYQVQKSGSNFLLQPKQASQTFPIQSSGPIPHPILSPNSNPSEKWHPTIRADGHLLGGPHLPGKRQGHLPRGSTPDQAYYPGGLASKESLDIFPTDNTANYASSQTIVNVAFNPTSPQGSTPPIHFGTTKFRWPSPPSSGQTWQTPSSPLKRKEIIEWKQTQKTFTVHKFTLIFFSHIFNLYKLFFFSLFVKICYYYYLLKFPKNYFHYIKNHFLWKVSTRGCNYI